MSSIFTEPHPLGGVTGSTRPSITIFLLYWLHALPVLYLLAALIYTSTVAGFVHNVQIIALVQTDAIVRNRSWRVRPRMRERGRFGPLDNISWNGPR